MAVPTVLITGALTGIGRATAFAFARDGANVVVSGRREDAGDRLAKELADVGGQAEFVRADVRFDEDLRRLVDRAVERFGRVDVAFNNAGVDAAVPIAEVTEGAYADIFDTNVRGTLLSVKHEFRVMRESGGGSIINSSSTYGLMGYPAASLYSGSKHAVIGITKSAALEGASFKIRVNAVAPGFTTTAMYERATGDDATREVLNSVLPLGRAGDPDEVAAAVQFLGSGRAAYITGQVLTLDGGLMAGWPLFPSAA